MTNTISTAVADKLKKSERALTALAVQDAIRAGWPIKLANDLKVVVNKMDVKVTYSKRNASAINDLEYGTPSSSPMPVIRLFNKRHASALDAIVTEAAVTQGLSEGVWL